MCDVIKLLIKNSVKEFEWKCPFIFFTFYRLLNLVNHLLCHSKFSDHTFTFLHIYGKTVLVKNINQFLDNNRKRFDLPFLLNENIIFEAKSKIHKPHCSF